MENLIVSKVVSRLRSGNQKFRSIVTAPDTSALLLLSSEAPEPAPGQRIGVIALDDHAGKLTPPVLGLSAKDALFDCADGEKLVQAASWGRLQAVVVVAVLNTGNAVWEFAGLKIPRPLSREEEIQALRRAIARSRIAAGHMSAQLREARGEKSPPVIEALLDPRNLELYFDLDSLDTGNVERDLTVGALSLAQSKA